MRKNEVRISHGSSSNADNAWNLLAMQDKKKTQFLLKQLVEIGLKILKADEGALLLADTANETLTFAFVMGKSQKLVGQTVPIGEGITGMAALTRDVQTTSAILGDSQLYHVDGDGRPASVLAAPMLSGDTLIGVLTAVSFSPLHSFTAEDCRTYGMLANVAACLVEQQERLTIISTPHEEIPSATAADECRLVKEMLELVRKKPKLMNVVSGMVDALKGI